MNNLKEKLITGVFWSALGRYSTLLIQLLVTIILARILSPYEFGVIGLLDVFIAIAYILSESGFSAALIQKKDFNKLEATSVFFFNLTISIFLYFLLYFVSPLIANFYNIPNLTTYSRALFLVIPINALSTIQNVILQNSMKFKKLALISFISALVSGLIGISLSYFGFGVWSLIGMALSMNLSKTILLIIINKWYPIFAFSYVSLKPLFKFGLNLMTTSLLITIFNNLYTLVIGKVYSTTDVGYYNQARRFQELSSNTITDTVLTVSFPALVNFKENISQLKETYKRIITLTVFIVVGVMSLLYLLSDKLFPLLLSSKWNNIIPYIKVLCVYGALFPLHQINNNILKVLKKGKTLLGLEICRRIILIIAICITIKYSILILLIGQIVSIFIVVLINMNVSGKKINYSLSNQIKDVYIYYLLSIFSVTIISPIISLIINPYINILIGTLLFILIYASLNFLFKQNAVYDLMSILKDKFKIN